MQGNPRRRGGGQRGQALAEFALMIPILLAVLLGAVDIGRIYATYVSVQNAAREGAAFGSEHPQCWAATGTNACSDPANMTYIARQELGGDTTLAVSVACSATCASTTSATANTVTVTTSQAFGFIVPGFLLPNLTIQATATAPIQ